MTSKTTDNELDAEKNHYPKWQTGRGWLGVIPGKTTIRDAINALGGSCETAEMANGFSFDFKDGLIRLTAIEQQGTISKIWISGKLSREGLVPDSLNSARSIFTNLRMVRNDSHNAEIYEAKGVRLAIASGNLNGSLLWIEFIPTD